jgi:hypothetical protein
MTLQDYMTEKGLSTEDFHHGIGISYSRVQQIKGDPNPVVSLDTIIKIWEFTKKKYGTGLTPWDYIQDLPEFYKK